MPSNGEVMFLEGSLMATTVDVTISTTSEGILEEDEVFTVGIDSSTPAMSTMGAPSIVELTIVNDDGEYS